MRSGSCLASNESFAPAPLVAPGWSTCTDQNCLAAGAFVLWGTRCVPFDVSLELLG